LMPGTEIAFDQNVECEPSFGIGILPNKKIGQRLARFRQINMDNAVTHHDALEFPDGQVVLVTRLCEGQCASVLQLPAGESRKLARFRFRSVRWLEGGGRWRVRKGRRYQIGRGCADFGCIRSRRRAKVACLLNGRAPSANRGLSLYQLERVRETNASGPEM